MALVNSDLFLVQDSVTKTNYKVNFENLIAKITERQLKQELEKLIGKIEVQEDIETNG